MNERGKHTISAEDMKLFLSDQRHIQHVYAQSGEKKLTYTHYGCFEVFHKGERLTITKDPVEAATLYNSL